MDLHLNGKVCLVTGASTGIGHATALSLAAEGARVIAAARSLESLSPLAAAMVAATGREPSLIAADLGRDEGAGLLAT